VPYVNFKHEFKTINLTLLGTFRNVTFITFSISLIFSFLRLHYRQKWNIIRKLIFFRIFHFSCNCREWKTKFLNNKIQFTTEMWIKFPLCYDCLLQLLLVTWIVSQCGPCTHILNTDRIYWTVLTVITQKLLLHVQLHNSTTHLLYKYCTNCTVCNWTVLTVITHKLLLHVQLHNSAEHLLYKYCTVCNWIVLTVITQKLLLHVQPHNSTAHLLYKLYSLQLNCTYSNYTEAAATCSAAQEQRNCQANNFW